ncbi:MAG TPA: hypothetical protein VMW51_10385 [Terriglobia bacterium]|nr:hypothetical protein [Terriglobia bacterium]
MKLSDRTAPRVQRLQSVGIQRISDERMRQILVEGLTPEHDDRHEHGELVEGAICYASRASCDINATKRCAGVPPRWPFEDGRWKPSERTVRNLEKAGALIAAEIDRLLRLREKENKGNAHNEE